MTYSAITTHSKNRPAYGRNQNVAYFKSTKSGIGPISNVVIILIIVCLMGLVYLTQVTKTYALGYRIDELTKREVELKDQHANLELESVKLRSIDRIKNSQASASLTNITPSSYAQ